MSSYRIEYKIVEVKKGDDAMAMSYLNQLKERGATILGFNLLNDSQNFVETPSAPAPTRRHRRKKQRVKLSIMFFIPDNFLATKTSKYAGIAKEESGNFSARASVHGKPQFSTHETEQEAFEWRCDILKSVYGDKISPFIPAWRGPTTAEDLKEMRLGGRP